MRKDLTGQTINNWKILYLFDSGTNKNTKYMCRCLKCGIEKVVVGSTISTGKSKMCRKCSAKLCQKRKYTEDPIVHIFSGMWQRCYDKNSARYRNYGGRGISICDEWLSNRESFYDWAYEHGYKKGLSIERIDVNGNYCPENCIFIPIPDQSKNRRSNHMITIDGETKCLSDWCRIYRADRHSVLKLYKTGIDWKSALEMKQK